MPDPILVRPKDNYNDVFHVQITCNTCKTPYIMDVERADYEKRKEGALIQEAFPYLTADYRELFITGMCGKCFDNLFKDDRFKG
jgi:hypothetical protein